MNFAWFNKKSTARTPAGTLDERVQAVEAGLRSLSLEWEDAYEKLMRALRRLNKRAQDQRERDEREEQSHQDAPGPTNGAPAGIDPISAKIMARRARVPTRLDGSG